VATHLRTAELRAYAQEVRRVMAQGARLCLTAFLLNKPAREGLFAGKGALAFDGAASEAEIYADPTVPTAAGAYAEDALLAIFLEAGLRRQRPAIYGRWSGRPRPGTSFQDINILEIDPTIPWRRPRQESSP
jgi:hypothetical protein